MEVILTKIGERKVKEYLEEYLEELKAKRKEIEILNARLDTANETKLPTIEDILSDIYSFEENNEYYNNWGVTDNYDGDLPIWLKENIDYNFVD